jgi:hypothetical protein
VATLAAVRREGAPDRGRLSRELAQGPDAARLEVVEDLPADQAPAASRMTASDEH